MLSMLITLCIVLEVEITNSGVTILYIDSFIFLFYITIWLERLIYQKFAFSQCLYSVDFDAIHITKIRHLA